MVWSGSWAPVGVLAAVLLALGLEGTRAAELSNLDSGLPNTLDDAYAVAPGRAELQGAAGYDHRHGRDANILESGLRYQFSERLTLGVGAGVGIGRDSPCFRGIASLQLGFGGH